MSLSGHDDVIQTFAPHRANQPLDVGRLPGRARRNAQFFQSQRANARLKFQAVDAVAIAEQVFRRRAKGKGFAKLLGRPTRRRAVDDIEVENSAAVMGQNEEDVEDLKGEGGDGQKIAMGTKLSWIPLRAIVVGNRSPVMTGDTKNDHVLSE